MHRLTCERRLSISKAGSIGRETLTVGITVVIRGTPRAFLQSLILTKTSITPPSLFHTKQGRCKTWNWYHGRSSRDGVHNTSLWSCCGVRYEFNRLMIGDIHANGQGHLCNLHSWKSFPSMIPWPLYWISRVDQVKISSDVSSATTSYVSLIDPEPNIYQWEVTLRTLCKNLLTSLNRSLHSSSADGS